MAPDKSQYDPSPPIPTYDEATAIGSSSNPDVAHSRSSLDDDHNSDREAQGLLGSGSGRPSDRRAPGGYRSPYVEDEEDEESQWSLASDEEGVPEDAQVRREMQELEIEDPLHDASSRSGWKRIALSIPKWSWRWRLPRFIVRLPRESDGANGNATDADATTASTSASHWSCPIPKVNTAAAFLFTARLLALFLVLAFLYLIFASDFFVNMTRRIGGQMFDPESVRLYAQGSIDWQHMRETLHQITGFAHVAGSEGDYALAMDVHSAFVNYGLEDVTVDEFYVYLNYPKAGGRAVQIMSQDGKNAMWSAEIEEEDPGGETAGRPTYVFHGHSKSGDVKGPLIYANYGSREDFKRLQDSGIDTKGAIALVRYYGTQGDRALKVKAAELAGFAGCIIYSDPADDGFVLGETAPQGRYMPYDGVQRGAVSLMSWVVGDVLTPGWSSRKGQPRETTTQTKGLVQIPSIPLAWRDAQILLKHLSGIGEHCPDEWRGGVPDVEWWTGNQSSPIVRLMNEQDEIEQQPIWNIYAKIAGVEQTMNPIIIGNHRDAWDFGAADPGSGTAVMLEVARVFGDLLSKGWRPLRTIEFMSWDAEEYNLIGSTEFVEDNLEYLRKYAFAYINLDTAVTGSEFRAAGSPMFAKALARVLERVHDPAHNATLRELWDQHGSELEGLGAGSDYVAFQDMAGTSSLDLRFDGPKFPYHSSYDNFDWMDRIGDPGFVYHSLLAQVLTLLVLELSDRPVLPFDLKAYALALGQYVDDLAKWADSKGANTGDEKKLDIGLLKKAVALVDDAVNKFEDWEAAWEQNVLAANGWEPAGLGRQRCEYNQMMADFETNLLDSEYGGGIPNRTQFVHTVFGPQLWSGYDEAYFPAIRDAIDADEWQLARDIVNKTAVIITAAGKALLV